MFERDWSIKITLYLTKGKKMFVFFHPRPVAHKAGIHTFMASNVLEQMMEDED